VYIVGGKLKGRRFYTPEGLRTTEGRIKEAVFNILKGINPVCVLDLFAGSGALGFEALSWLAAEKVYFVEKNKKHSRIIKKNVQGLGVYSRSYVFCMDAFVFLEKKLLPCRPDLVFLDPPYKENLITKCLKTLYSYDILSDSSFVVVLSFWQEKTTDEGFFPVFERRYGDRVVKILRKK
jgi:16S rRNA (guanine(966)-N(2))-methyltransferase RsmD